uniref:inositol-polyphosphate 5-phosphatase n=1 Tax=Cyprinus carpio TaxID=7962 RepID=A0A8C1PRG0_CYPCA
MEMHTDVLLVTANVGSLFDNVGDIEGDWLQEFFMTVHKHTPRFIALHFQEVGGKDYKRNMGHAKKFFLTIESRCEMADFDKVCVYVDSHFNDVDSFTALGSMYFIHKSLKNIQQYDFKVKEFKAISGLNKYVGSLEGVTTVEKEKFPKNFWPDFTWSRKGYMRTRWLIHNQGLDLVNVHLFHDASNLIACNSSPSVYSANRKKALRYVINRISDNSSSPLPFFLFGDFNFRLDTLSLVQNLSMSADIMTVKNGSSNEVEKIICEEKDNDHKLLKYDKEISEFHDVITEEEIHFPPSYPYSEDYAKPTQYMNTRCPAWCDRILMSHSTRDIIHRREEGKSGVVYNTLGSDICMGDHKPVFLFFTMKTFTH